MLQLFAFTGESNQYSKIHNMKTQIISAFCLPFGSDIVETDAS
jgi:hypothetical protein